LMHNSSSRRRATLWHQHHHSLGSAGLGGDERDLSIEDEDEEEGEEGVEERQCADRNYINYPHEDSMTPPDDYPSDCNDAELDVVDTYDGGGGGGGGVAGTYHAHRPHQPHEYRHERRQNLHQPSTFHASGLPLQRTPASMVPAPSYPATTPSAAAASRLMQHVPPSVVNLGQQRSVSGVSSMVASPHHHLRSHQQQHLHDTPVSGASSSIQRLQQQQYLMHEHSPHHQQYSHHTQAPLHPATGATRQHGESHTVVNPHHLHHHPHHHQQQALIQTPSGGYLTSSEGANVEATELNMGGQRDSMARARRRRALQAMQAHKPFLDSPITWTPTQDGSALIGHMVLKKNLAYLTASGLVSGSTGADSSPASGRHSVTGATPTRSQRYQHHVSAARRISQLGGAAVLGLKVVGGRLAHSGYIGAIVERVKRGSIADLVGQLRPGDEIIEWNRVPLRGKSYEEVRDIIADSKSAPQVELLVSQPLVDSLTMVSPVRRRHLQSAFGGPFDSEDFVDDDFDDYETNDDDYHDERLLHDCEQLELMQRRCHDLDQAHNYGDIFDDELARYADDPIEYAQQLRRRSQRRSRRRRSHRHRLTGPTDAHSLSCLGGPAHQPSSLQSHLHDPFVASSSLVASHQRVPAGAMTLPSEPQSPSPPPQQSIQQQPTTGGGDPITTTGTAVSGRLQVRLSYDAQASQLMVTIVSASELMPTLDGRLRNPFAKLYVLPERSDKYKRRTKTLVRTNDPKWNQTFIYSPFRRSKLRTRCLDISVWDYDRYTSDVQLLGQVLIELASAPLDDVSEWYWLCSREEIVQMLRQQRKTHLLMAHELGCSFSPPSTASRGFSDAELTDIERDDNEALYHHDHPTGGSRDSWRALLADTSQDSFGSSPPTASHSLRAITPLPAGGHLMSGPGHAPSGGTSAVGAAQAPMASSGGGSTAPVGAGAGSHHPLTHQTSVGSDGGRGRHRTSIKSLVVVSGESGYGYTPSSLSGRPTPTPTGSMANVASAASGGSVSAASGRARAGTIGAMESGGSQTMTAATSHPHPHRGALGYLLADNPAISSSLPSYYSSGRTMSPGGSHTERTHMPGAAAMQGDRRLTCGSVRQYTAMRTHRHPSLEATLDTGSLDYGYVDTTPTERLLRARHASMHQQSTAPVGASAVAMDAGHDLGATTSGAGAVGARPKFQKSSSQPSESTHATHHAYGSAAGVSHAPSISYGHFAKVPTHGSYMPPVQHVGSLDTGQHALGVAAAGSSVPFGAYYSLGPQSKSAMASGSHLASQYSHPHSATPPVPRRKLPEAPCRHPSLTSTGAAPTATTKPSNLVGVPSHQPRPVLPLVIGSQSAMAPATGVMSMASDSELHTRHRQQAVGGEYLQDYNYKMYYAHPQPRQSSAPGVAASRHQHVEDKGALPQAGVPLQRERPPDTSSSKTSLTTSDADLMSLSALEDRELVGTAATSFTAAEFGAARTRRSGAQGPVYPGSRAHNEPEHGSRRSWSSEAPHSSGQTGSANIATSGTGGSTAGAVSGDGTHGGDTGSVSDSTTQAATMGGTRAHGTSSAPGQEQSSSSAERAARRAQRHAERQRRAQGQTQAKSLQHQQHSSDKSIGGETAGGSSQSLKSQSGAGATTSGSLSKKSNSATQLSLSGTKKRLGFRKKQTTSFSVHRSEEVAPHDMKHLVKQTNSMSSEGEGSVSGESGAQQQWMRPERRVAQLKPSDVTQDFVEGLGAGQIVSRQALASPYLGDIQLSLSDRKDNLEVEVIRARRLQKKPSAKVLPAPYVKVYLIRNGKCVAKAKTCASRRTLDPLYQQQLTFQEDYRGCVLQAIVWGDYGRIERKSFMGIVQVQLDELNLSSIVIGWYKLFNQSSLITVPSKSLRHALMATSTESFT
ncbi:Regulating synaptic membrane exocytosis protein 1, partial [Fragariocoptes setiger]